MKLGTAAAMLTLLAATLVAAPVSVRYPEGLVHGFLTLRSLDGELLADGDLLQVAHGRSVTSHLVFHFKDGSLHDETTVFSQGKIFHFESSHLIQKGPAFKRALDVRVDDHGHVTTKTTDADGSEKVDNDDVQLPADLANGVILTLLKNVRPEAPPTLSMLVSTPKPRVLKLVVTSAGEEPFHIGTAERRAVHYVVKPEIGGLTGVMATVFGKTPPDSHVWILQGDAPAFVKSESPFYAGGPLWRIELVSPTWP
jgi:hypothetical protein